MSQVIVAVGWLAEPTDERVQALARALGVTVFEARSRVQPPAPRVVAIFQDPDEARARVEALHAAGFLPIGLDGDSLGYGVQRFVVRSFELLPDRLRLESRTGAAREILNEEIRLLVSGLASSFQQHTTQCPPLRNT